MPWPANHARPFILDPETATRLNEAHFDAVERRAPDPRLAYFEAAAAADRERQAIDDLARRVTVALCSLAGALLAISAAAAALP